MTTARLFPRSIRTITALGAVAALSVAAAPAAASGEDQVSLAVAAKAVEAGVRFEVVNRSLERTVDNVRFQAPAGAVFEALESEHECAAEGRDAYCYVKLAPGASTTIVARGDGLRAGQVHEACGVSYEPVAIEGCVDATVDDDAPPLPPPPPPDDAPKPMPVPPDSDVKVPSPAEDLMNAVRNGYRPLPAKCRCSRISVGVKRLLHRGGRKAGQVRGASFDAVGQHAGFMLKWRMNCTRGIDPTDCAGDVTVVPPVGVQINPATQRVACKGNCGLGATGQMYVRMTGARAARRVGPLAINVRHQCANGRVQITRLRFVFRPDGSVDVQRSRLGADIR